MTWARAERTLRCTAAFLTIATAQAWAQPYQKAATGGDYMHNYLLPPAASSTPWWPAWSPDGQWVAFAMDGSLWRMRVNGGRGDGEAEEILRDKDYLSSPEWSPDGRYLAFTADDDGKRINVRVLHLATGVVTDVTTGAFVNIEPARATVTSLAPIARVELVSNGRVVHAVDVGDGQQSVSFTHTMQNPGSAWYSLRAVGAASTFPVENTRPLAVTNPVYVIVGGHPIRDRSSAAYFVRWIDVLTGMAETHPGWRSDKEKAHVLAQFKEARDIFVARGEDAR